MGAADNLSMPEAMRAAAAALVAEQHIVDEQEAHVRGREAELARQERQVAERLAEQVRHVEDLRQQLAVGREQFRDEREQIEQLREETETARREAIAERDRLRVLKPKFLRRMKRQWSAERKDAEKRQAHVDRLRRTTEQDAAKLMKERAAFERECADAQKRAEEQRERLSRDAQALAETHARFTEERQAAIAEIEHRSQAVAQQAHAAEQIRREAESIKPDLEKHCEVLRAEARGLEQRVSHARRLLLEAEAQRATIPVSAPVAAHPLEIAALLAAVPEADRTRLTEYYQRCQGVVQAQAAQLADQRTHLVELYERLSQAETGWEKRQQEAVDEMERLCGELQTREESLRTRSREVEATAERLRQERDRVNRLRSTAERQAGELAIRQADWRHQRDRLATELDERSQVLHRREEALASLFRRWRDRRQAEVSRLRDAVRDNLAARETWARERDEFERRSESVRIAQQALVEQALALEEARREFLKDVERPDLAAKHIERLHRRWEGLTAASHRELQTFRERLVEEDAELRQIYGELQKQQEELARRERELAQRLTELENERRQVAVAGHEAESLRSTWEQQHRLYEERIAELHAQIEQVKDDDQPPAILAAA
jgi:hypothetical protein